MCPQLLRGAVPGIYCCVKIHPQTQPFQTITISASCRFHAQPVRRCPPGPRPRLGKSRWRRAGSRTSRKWTGVSAAPPTRWVSTACSPHRTSHHGASATTSPHRAERKPNCPNNQLEELPQISRLQSLAHRNLARNRLNTLPPGFASHPALPVLDLTDTNLKENSPPGKLFCLPTPRALYLSANDFDILLPDTGTLKVASIG